MVSLQNADEFPRCSVEPPVKDGGKIDAQIMSAKALQRVFPAKVASCCPASGGWIHQETLCNRSSATFDLRQCEWPHLVTIMVMARQSLLALVCS